MFPVYWITLVGGGASGTERLARIDDARRFLGALTMTCAHEAGGITYTYERTFVDSEGFDVPTPAHLAGGVSHVMSRCVCQVLEEVGV